MMGMRPNVFWIFCWKYLAPVSIMVIFISQCFAYQSLFYGNYKYPLWADIIGLGISFSSMIWIPFYMIYYLLTQPGSLSENFQKGILPNIKQREVSVCDTSTGKLITESNVVLIPPSNSSFMEP
ncbi:hypothetical protein JTB14_026324 [Gonioctena quinquepunctata]|nr:hypothetical protein JTB14_026324 [Gonioctena quinquepunctata]